MGFQPLATRLKKQLSGKVGMPPLPPPKSSLDQIVEVGGVAVCHEKRGPGFSDANLIAALQKGGNR